MNLISIQAGKPKSYGDPGKGSLSEREWTTGFYKIPVTAPVELTALGITTDGQADQKAHGGVDKAICVYSADHFPSWQATLGLDMRAGAFGENFTVQGATEHSVCLGDLYQAGELLFQVSQPRQPCWKLARRWQVKTLAAQVQENGKTGWYLRVLKTGTLEAPTSLKLVKRTHEQWTIKACNAVFYAKQRNHKQLTALAACSELSEAWRESILKKVQ